MDDSHITIDTIAKRAGVSTTTVSRVINRPELVRPETRDAVYHAMRTHGYTPRASRRPNSPTTGRTATGTIGLAVADIRLSVVAELIRQFQFQLAETHYDLLLIDLKGERDATQFFLRNQHYAKKLDGLVVFSANLDEEGAGYFRSIDVPVVLLQVRSKWAKCISTNNYLGGQDATAHLIHCGYRSIAFIGWEPDDDRVRDRFNGYIAALSHQGVSFSEELTARAPITSEGGYRATEKILGRAKPHAIFYACDTMALGGMRCLRDHHLAIPEDVAIVGFDDLEVAEAVGLTTMQQYIGVKAEMAISYLLEQLAERPEHASREEISITPRLVVRETTGS
jgi:LacI family transcriptional regulator